MLPLVTIALLWSTASSTAQIPDTHAEAHNNRHSRVFVENRGQWPDEVQYKAAAPGVTAWITRHGIVYDFYENVKSAASRRTSNAIITAADGFESSVVQANSNVVRRGHVVRMTFTQSANALHVQGLDPLPALHNYFLGSDPDRWASDVRLFAESTISNVSDGVDARLYYDDGYLRYDLIVHPRADMAPLALRFEGADSVSITSTGALALHTQLGIVEHRELLAYQEIQGKRRKVQCAFTISNDGEVGFDVQAIDPTESIVIDPLIYATYLGGSGEESRGSAITVDRNGSAYIVGNSLSEDFPTTEGAYNEDINDASGFEPGDIIISKLDPLGENLEFSTFLGGSADEFTGFLNNGGWLSYGNSIALGPDGAIVVVGVTQSEDFPMTSNSLSTIKQGQFDAFAAVLSADGSNLLYSTYLGGNAEDAASAVSVDPFGMIYIAGQTNAGESTNTFPTTPEAFQSRYDRHNDIFITKIDTAQSEPVYSTFVGGRSHDFVSEIVVDTIGNVFFCGSTASGNFPTTPDVFDSVIDGTSAFDAYVAKLNPEGSDLVFLTLLGGDLTEHCSGIALDNEGYVYVVGHTTFILGEDWTFFPTTEGAYRRDGQGAACFVTKLLPDGTDLVYSTYVGGRGQDRGNAVKISGNGVAYVGGHTNSTDFPTTDDALQRERDITSADAFLTAVNHDGTKLLYSTYIGGNASEWISGLAFDDNDGVYIAGRTWSPNFPVTPAAYDTTLDDGNQSNVGDIFVMKFGLPFCTMTASIRPDTALCGGDNVVLYTAVADATEPLRYTWTPTGGLNDAAAPAPIASPEATTVYTVEIVDDYNCKFIDSVKITVLDRLEYDAGPDQSICHNGRVRIGALPRGGTPPYSYDWLPRQGLSNPVTARPFASPNTTTTYYVTISDRSGCPEIIDSVTVFVSADAVIPIETSGDVALCSGESVRLKLPEGFADYQWSNGETTATITVTEAGSYNARLRDANGCEFDSETIVISIESLVQPELNGADVICRFAEATYRVEGAEGAQVEWIAPPGGEVVGSPIGPAARILWQNAGEWDVVVVSTNRCGSSTASMRVTVVENPTADAGNDIRVCAGESAQLQATGGLYYQWTPEEGLSAADIPDPIVTPATTTTYTVTVTSPQGCVSSAAVSVIVTDELDLHITGAADICRGASLELQATGANEYTWFTRGGDLLSTTERLTATPASDTWYFVAGSSGVCSGIDSIFVQVHEPPAVTVRAERTDVCAGASVQLQASGALTYVWSPSEGLNDTASASPLASPQDTTEYTVTGIDANGCASHAVVTLNVAPRDEMIAALSAPDRDLFPGDTLLIELHVDNIPQQSPMGSLRLRLRYDAEGLRLQSDGVSNVEHFDGWAFSFNDHPNAGYLEIQGAGPAVFGAGVVQLAFDVFLFSQRRHTTAIDIIDFETDIDKVCRDIAASGVELRLSDFCLRSGRGIVVPSSRFALHTIVPNPAARTTRITYTVGFEGRVRLSLFNALGNEIGRLADRIHKEGAYNVEINAAALSAGAYYIRMQSAEFTQVRMIIIE